MKKVSRNNLIKVFVLVQLMKKKLRIARSCINIYKYIYTGCVCVDIHIIAIEIQLLQKKKKKKKWAS